MTSVKTESELFDYLAQCGIGRIEVRFYSTDEDTKGSWFVYDINGKSREEFLWRFVEDEDEYAQFNQSLQQRAIVFEENRAGDGRVIFDIPARTITLRVAQKVEGSAYKQEDWYEVVDAA